MTWFEALTGFPERSGDDVRSKIRLDGTRLTSLVNGREFDAGSFATPTLSDLRRKTKPRAGDRICVSETVGCVRALHADTANANAVFQVASQFNCLEMATPAITPEDGIGIYETDWTQGPACSISAGAGTIYRNYFANVNGHVGQTRDNQIDCLEDVGRHFGRDFWQMENGYCFPTASGLQQIENRLANCSSQELDEIRAKLRVGVQSQTQVTVDHAVHFVSQVFCSALPVAYSNISNSQWDHFPRLVLDATYESTFHVAVQNLEETVCRKLYLTLVGGGVFGNRSDWILSAIARSLELFAWADLDVRIVSHGSSNAEVGRFLRSI
ncbi:MAG: hypothetical protein Aurels2KO_31360 [Aureliella sp.]